VGWHRSIYNLLNYLTFITLMTSHARGKDFSSLEKLQALMKHKASATKQIGLSSTAWGRKLKQF